MNNPFDRKSCSAASPGWCRPSSGTGPGLPPRSSGCGWCSAVPAPATARARCRGARCRRLGVSEVAQGKAVAPALGDVDAQREVPPFPDVLDSWAPGGRVSCRGICPNGAGGGEPRQQPARCVVFVDTGAQIRVSRPGTSGTEYPSRPGWEALGIPLSRGRGWILQHAGSPEPSWCWRPRSSGPDPPFTGKPATSARNHPTHMEGT